MTLDLLLAQYRSDHSHPLRAPEVPVLVGSLCIALVPFIASTKMSILSKSTNLGTKSILSSQRKYIAQANHATEGESSLVLCSPSLLLYTHLQAKRGYCPFRSRIILLSLLTARLYL